MKKLFSILIAATLLLSLCACGSSAPAATEPPVQETPTPSAAPSASPTGESMGQALLKDFSDRVNAEPELGAEELAKALLENPEEIPTELSCMREMLFSDDSLSEKDCMLNWSFLRQAVTAGALPRKLEEVDALLTASSPGHLDAAAGRTLESDERGAYRLQIFRDFLGAEPPERRA